MFILPAAQKVMNASVKIGQERIYTTTILAQEECKQLLKVNFSLKNLLFSHFTIYFVFLF